MRFVRNHCFFFVKSGEFCDGAPVATSQHEAFDAPVFFPLKLLGLRKQEADALTHGRDK